MTKSIKYSMIPILIFIIITSYGCSHTKQITLTSNPDLEFAKSDYKGNFLINGLYRNTETDKKFSYSDVIKWALTPNKQHKEKKKDTFSLEIERDLSFHENDKDVMIWLGHAFFYIRLNGITYLTDPITSDIPTAKRKVDNPYLIEELGKIDYILISHAHYDHLDIPTLRSITKQNPNAMILCPLGGKAFLKRKKFNAENIQEAGWFQTYNTETNIVNFLPAKHWSRRGVFDFNKVLWGGFAISSNSFKIYFAGDTAEELDFFSEIKKLHDTFDFCLIPIGSYSPQYLLKSKHINPQEAITLFETIEGKHFIPMHYGTYDLSDEPLGEPLRALMELAKETGIINKIIIMTVGKPLYIDKYKKIDE